MKCILLALLIGGLLMCASGVVHAGNYTFSPIPRDLGDLDHWYYYSWGINWTVPINESVVGATLSIENINDWTVEADDVLYVHLLDNALLGVRQYYDGQVGGDAYDGQGPLVGIYSDENGSTPENVTYDLEGLGLLDELETFLADGRFGFGFDPDCHYYNCGVTLTITTGESAVPEPGSFAAILGGPMSFVGLRMRRKI